MTDETTTPRPTRPTSPRHRKSFSFPLPVDEIDAYMKGRAGKRMKRSAVEQDIEDYLKAAAEKAQKDADGVKGIMAKVLGS